jgi:membrane-bound metal-dependent hydrolase YbcI (DUF457 family)
VDIVTHGMMGVIVASPFAATHPEAAAAFMFGSVAPDLDAFTRVFGRQAFMRAHQTYSHAYPVIALIGLAAWGAREAFGVYAPWAPLAFALGMAFHSTLDWTNTYGIALLAPFSRRRFCREWVFFIDSVVVSASVALLVLVGLRLSRGDPTGWQPQAAYGVTMLAYWVLKAALRRRAWARCPEGTVSLLPSALVPWRYLGCAQQEDGVLTFAVDALTGEVSAEERHAILDQDFAATLEALAEWRAMRALSPAYHVVSAEPGDAGTKLLCRDLRTRNFSTRFGQLEVELDAAGAVVKREFHV